MSRKDRAHVANVDTPRFFQVVKYQKKHNANSVGYLDGKERLHKNGLDLSAAANKPEREGFTQAHRDYCAYAEAIIADRLRSHGLRGNSKRIVRKATRAYMKRMKIDADEARHIIANDPIAYAGILKRMLKKDKGNR